MLLLWGPNNSSESVKDCVNIIKQKVGTEGKVQVEHTERLLLCKLKRFFPRYVSYNVFYVHVYLSTQRLFEG